jgi:THO complex subunit 4
MSSILASLDMSLDDIISKKKTSNPDARPAKSGGRGGRGAATGGAGPVRNRRNRSGRNEPYSRGVSPRLSMCVCGVASVAK